MVFDVPVLNRSEIVIAGAGPAGIAAGLAAARLGKSVILIEQSGTPGGMGTAGLVPAVICQGDGVDYVAGEICRSIVEECCMQMGITEVNPLWQEVDAEIMKRIYDRRILEAGIRLYYGMKVVETGMREGRIVSLVVSTPNGLKRIEGDVFLDCTGDAAVSMLARVPFRKGDENGNTMAPTLCSQYSNIDVAAYEASIAGNGNDLDIWHRLLKTGNAPLDEHHFVGVCTYGHGTASGNLGHIYGTDTLDEDGLTHCYIRGRELAEIFHRFYREHVPGFAASDLVQTASQLGVRESRRIDGLYCLNYADYEARASFDDEIGRFAYPVDIHASKADPEAQRQVEENIRKTRYRPGESYGIPYRSLVPRTVGNLLVAGRCISTDRALQSSIRVIPGCMLTGQAAGAAATLCVERGCSAAEVPTPELQKRIRRIGGFLRGPVKRSAACAVPSRPEAEARP